MKRDDLTAYLLEYLESAEFSDYGPNGLQVEGKPEVETIVTGVSASVELFERAIELDADAVLVHHGLIWKGVQPLYRGGYRERVRLLLAHDITLYGFHLPLDAHPEIGNNAILAGRLGLTDLEPFCLHQGRSIGFQGQTGGISVDELTRRLTDVLDREPLVFPHGPENVRTVGIVTGGAQDNISDAVESGLDAYITGEVNERTRAYAKEEGIHFFSAGHHATEILGVQALGEHLADRFGLRVEYVDVPNPV